jgi:hypothetical protein
VTVLTYVRIAGEALPWLWPGAAMAGPAAALLARPAARVLRARAWHAGALLLALAGILLVTLTPSPVGSLVTGQAGNAPAFCLMGVEPPTLAPHLEEASLNVALFVPAALAATLLPVPRVRWSALAALVVLPVVVEACQFLAYTELGRSCQAQDVVQNVTGVAIGAAVGLALLPLCRVLDQDRRPPAMRPERATPVAAASAPDRAGR